MHKSAPESAKPYRPLPDKLFYKIGEVSQIVGVEPYVLRYWESEFPFLKPRKSRSGQRVYVKKTIELILEVKKLLYEERYTIEGVRKRLGGGTIQLVEPASEPEVQTSEVKKHLRSIEHVKKRLKEILSQLQ
ncbi:MAG: MerR family transcriptional regulator [Nitrospirota bacterium]|nr:MerR family transcriptional regulator [Nitrospirota bacterium]MDH5769068.1 MerR family transcriptional regulator [Nitrospirota bacterium]